MRPHPLLLACCLAPLAACPTSAPPRPDIRADLPPDRAPSPAQPEPGREPGPPRGVVTASEPLAAAAGAAVLASGGNAVDAAVVVLFMLNVVEPQSSGIGGGGLMMVYVAAEDETYVLNARERAPGAVTPDMFASQPTLRLRSSSGYAVGVPGAVRGAATALGRWGTRTLAESLQPAIEAARDGFPISSRLAGDLRRSGLTYEQGPPHNPVKPAYDVARAVFRPAGAALEAGDLLVQPELARTFMAIAEHGPDAFYDCGHPAGIARAIVATQSVARRRNRGGEGRMTCADLAEYHVDILTPLRSRYREYDIVTAPPPSSGGIGLLQMLGMLERFPLGDADAGFGAGQASTLNVTLEAMRLAFADRALWVGDQDCPGCRDVPVEGLLAGSYLATRAAQISVGARGAKFSAGDPRPHDPRVDAQGRLQSGDDDDDTGDTDTTHFTIVDGDGNIVSHTTSLSAVWGSGLMVAGHGFLLNSQLTSFNRVPRHNPDPAAHDPGANDLAPFKRPRSSMTPTFIFLDGAPVAAFGSPGGMTIINTALNLILALVDHRETLEQAVRAPRVSLSSASKRARARIEPGFDRQLRERLGALGYAFDPVPAIGAVQAILTDPESGKQHGVADARRLGAVATADEHKAP